MSTLFTMEACLNEAQMKLIQSIGAVFFFFLRFFIYLFFI